MLRDSRRHLFHVGFAAIALAFLALRPSGTSAQGNVEIKERTPHASLVPVEVLKPPMDLDRVRAWVGAAMQHKSGHPDASALTIAAWSPDALAVTLTDVAELSEAFAWLHGCGPAAAECHQSRIVYRGHMFAAGHGRAFVPLTNHIDVLPGSAATLASTIEGLADVLAATPDDEQAGTVNRLLERGALLHTDLALMTASSMIPVTSASTPGTPGTLRLDDGAVVDVESTGDHWRDARFLLDAIDTDPARLSGVKWSEATPAPQADAFVRRWYEVTSEAQVAEGRWSDATPNLAHGLLLFPDDASLLFQSGAMHETFGSSDLQASAQAAVRAGLAQGVVSAPREWAAAKAFLEQATAKDPASAEIHLHLGHVLEESGEFPAAIRELAAAAGHLGQTDLEYDAAMFQGRAEEGAADLAAARSSFEHAVALGPGVQSALLALSRIVRIGGDPDGAHDPLLRAIVPPKAGATARDPLWDYDRSYTRDAEIHLADLERPFATGGRR